MQSWQKVSSKTVHTNPWWSVEEHDVIRPDGQPGKYFVAKRASFCAIIALREDNSFYLIRQMRYPTGQMGWEIPQGLIDPGEEPMQAAIRELKEETGLQAAHMTQIAELEAEKGITASLAHIFVATGLTEGASTDQEHEGIQACRPYHLAAANDLIRNGEIHDDITTAALYLAQLHGHLPPAAPQG